MRNTLISLVCYLITTNCIGQGHNLLSFFDNIALDSIVNTMDFAGKNIREKIIDDSLVIRYFLANKKENLHYLVEEYDMDDNTYSNVTYKRKVFGLFSKKVNSKVLLLCYWMDGINYLAIYNTKIDIISNIYKFRMPPEEGESFIQSILFPNNYVFTIETEVKTRVKLVEIDYVNGKFIERKNIIMDDIMYIEDVVDHTNEKYQKALKLIGISETGELLEVNP
jgi:hypothetical protein